jgi:hypothetical protein
MPPGAHFAICGARQLASFQWLVEKTWKRYVVASKVRVFRGHPTVNSQKAQECPMHLNIKLKFSVNAKLNHQRVGQKRG